jgi:hypothetical protein
VVLITVKVESVYMWQAPAQFFSSSTVYLITGDDTLVCGSAV